MGIEWLWTDVFFLVFLGIAGFSVLLSLRNPLVMKSFALILKKPMAVSAGLILLFYLTIAVLDSIHFQWDKEGLTGTESLFDHMVYPLGSVYEKTYSAPLALSLYVMETEIEKGVYQSVYPRLKYPSSAIKNAKETYRLIGSIVLKSFTQSVFALLSFIIILFIFLRHQFKVTPALVSALITLFILIFLTWVSYAVSRHFHLLGTGQIGEDIFYRAIKSIRTGMIIGLLTTLFMLPLALFFGIAAGYFGGVIDDVIQYLYTTLSSVPGVLLITASVLSLQTYITNHPQQFATLAQTADARLLALCLILGVTSWTSLCRLLRAETLKLREVDFVIAGRALGSGWVTLFRKHLLPNVMHIVVMTIALDFSFLVMAEALLSYVGVGVSSMTISWGNMINGARLELARDPVVWWPIVAAFFFMFFLVLAINLFADALRDAFDPHHSNV